MMSTPSTLADLHGDRPHLADQHRPAVAGALWDARSSLLRAASALASHPEFEYPPPVRAAIARITAASTLAARDIERILGNLPGVSR